ncbi:hypothetical protein ACO2Q3_20990 [Caulobacter sp. KR2-114]|uniref:hypothetical protein n=1 Tax=Caulobacter sp. KR2-114 TaxID=3400912 RepID=UPI003BFE74A5
MKILLISAAAGSALGLAACATPFKGDIASMDASAQGANINGGTGATAGAVTLKGHFVPALAADGKTPILGQDECGRAVPLDAYSILHGSATASATGTGGASPQIAVAANTMSAAGASARYAALGGGAAPTADVVAASKDCSKAVPETASATALAH